MEEDDGSVKKKRKFEKSHHNKYNRSVTSLAPKANSRPLNSSNLQNDWDLYFPDNIPEGDLTVMSKLRIVEHYFLCYEEDALIEIHENRYFTLNVSHLSKKDSFLSWPKFLTELTHTPVLVMSIFGYAMERVIKLKCSPDLLENSKCNLDNVPQPKIVPRFIGSSNLLRFQDLKTYNYGHFVTVMGIVVCSADVKPFCVEIAFSCLKCQEIQITKQEKGCYTYPNKCFTKGCYSKTFKPLLDSPYTQTVPWKSIRLQELNADQSEGGRVPRSLECELACDLTDRCIPGDVVIISGIADVNNANEKKMTASKDACNYSLFINANSVTCIKGKNVDDVDENNDLKSEDVIAIKKIHSESNIFRLIVASLSPNIFGHELIKAGMALALFGGSANHKENSLNAKISTRENSHVLVVGDPGLGKSQMLLACANVSPRGVYVCGNSTTASGLTVTISKGGGGENSLEAGALVLADQGHCCIDEFDKMMQQHSALLEAMEQQTISIAKSGVVCTLPARTSIIAVANPSGGHYSKSKTVSENLKINGALLSRFDLVFILQDNPDTLFDDKMSNHVMGLHTEPKVSHHFEKPLLNESLSIDGDLKKRLQLKFNEKLNYIPHNLLQKYITYAKRFSQPKLTPPACDLIKKIYLDMRRIHKVHQGSPITTRQLESLIRLTRARARVELRSHCTVEDAKDVIQIMKYSMWDTFSDESGFLDVDRSIHGSGMSNRSQAKKLMNGLTKAAKTKADDCFTVSEIKDIAKTLKISLNSFQCILDSLNDHGFLLKKGFQLYKIQTL
ncbi:DNA helicase MCM8 [Parasteatoda tepidariorum]|uniref:DNA helicase MCM8 n=1 Tax=Parasteatoda tepidariorum TaxID=114398 RepID=UPI001C72616E|nr:DNA helicase MCM8 [Parasteatoda tepidariorum]